MNEVFPYLWEAFLQGVYLVQWYAREHILLCLVPALFIAGAMSVFIRHGAVIKYLGPSANKFLAYGMASISGSVLAVCSCTVLPLFVGIHGMGAGLGPAIAFLYSGPAINVLAIIMTARILGLKLGLARALAAILFSIIIGLIMHLLFVKEKGDNKGNTLHIPENLSPRPIWKELLLFSSMLLILIFANWGGSSRGSGFWHLIYVGKWYLVSIVAFPFLLVIVPWYGTSRRWLVVVSAGVVGAALLFPQTPEVPFALGLLGLALVSSRSGGDGQKWFSSSLDFGKQIFPLLFLGVFVSGFLLGRPGHSGVIPAEWVTGLVGGNSFISNFASSILGVFMYFATLTEIPIVEALLGSGMGPGPALALLLAGPALSLPNMLVINSFLGFRKTAAYCLLVIFMSTVSGMIFGFFNGEGSL